MVIVHGKEERGVGTYQLCSRKTCGLRTGARVAGDRGRCGTLAAQIGLRVGHEKSDGDSLAGDVAVDETELLVAEM